MQEANMAHDVFISYGKPDQETAIKLYHELREAGARPWIDQHDILPGRNWKTAVNKAIRECKYFLALLSSKTISTRGFVQKEIRIALDILDEFPSSEVFIIPVLTSPCNPADERLAELHSVKLYESYEKGIQQILKVFSLKRETPLEAPPDAPPPEASNLFSAHAETIQGLVQGSTIHKIEQHFYGSPEPPENRPSQLAAHQSQEPESSSEASPETNEAKPAAHILHLSDLHFGDLDYARCWRSQLADDLKKELDCDRLDGLIISGDITKKSEPHEYDAAARFLENLCAEFSLESSQLVIVPGNHDVNWGLSKKSYKIMDLEDVEGELIEGKYIRVGEDAVRIRKEDQYKDRFRNFAEFYLKIKGESYPADYSLQGTLHVLKDLNILVLGLNSAWEIDHHFQARASIRPDAVSIAMDQVRGDDTCFVKFAVWHHPLNSAFEDRIRDHGFMERLAQNGFSVCFHGHLHKADTELYQYDKPSGDRKIHMVAAGTFGAPVKKWTPGVPLQYNFLKLSGNRLTVETRSRRELNGAWKPDAIWMRGKGKDPSPRYVLELP